MYRVARALAQHLDDDCFIARLRHYTDLAPADVRTLRALVENEMTVKKRRDLVVDGYEYRKLCFIQEGFAARYKVLHNGKRQIINVLVPGDVIGLPGSFLDRASYSVIAITDMRLHVCPLDDFVALCYRNPKIGLALTWLAVHEGVSNAERIIDVGRRTSLERLARFLLEVHARLAMVGRAEKSRFELPFSQEVMSDALGLSVPHLNRVFGRLRATGLIVMRDRQVEFADRKAIESLAHFHPVKLSRVPAMALS